AQHRFQRVMGHFVEVFVHPTHPLVLFLDDLQWADSASLGLLQQLLTGTPTGGLLLIGAYRDHEVDPSHPLRRAIEAVAQAGSLVELGLAPLGVTDLETLLTETLRSRPEQVHALAALLQRKTNGNPFFVNLFLQTLYSEGLLHYQPGQG